MAKRRFNCETCRAIRVLYYEPKCNVICKCGSTMQSQLPCLAGEVQVRETVDKNHNVTWIQDQEKILQDRKQEYYWSIEVPKMVHSGVYSRETMLENGWIYVNDKEEVVIRMTPPQGD